MTEWTPQSKASTWTESNFRPSWCKTLVMNLVMSIFSVLKAYYGCITNIYCPNHWVGIPTGYMLDWQLRCCIKLYDSSDFLTLIQIAVAPVNVLLMPCDIFYFYRATEIRANTRYGEAPPPTSYNLRVITLTPLHRSVCRALPLTALETSPHTHILMESDVSDYGAVTHGSLLQWSYFANLYLPILIFKGILHRTSTSFD